MKNRSYRNEKYQTEAQQIFSGKQLLTKRPEGMSRDDYKALMKHQTWVLDQLFRRGHSPNRKLAGALSPHKPLITGAGFRRRNFNRKSS